MIATPKVEIGFGDPPTEASPTWVDVTSYVEATSGIVVTRGNVSGERQSPESGQVTFTLNNDDDRFDPENASSPYYGDLTARCPVRISIDPDAGGYDVVFRGYMDGGWRLSNDGSHQWVEITALDALGWCESLQMPTTAWDALVERIPSTATADLYHWFKPRAGSGDLVDLITKRTARRITDQYGTTASCLAGADYEIPVGAGWHFDLASAEEWDEGVDIMYWFRIIEDPEDPVDQSDPLRVVAHFDHNGVPTHVVEFNDGDGATTDWSEVDNYAGTYSATDLYLQEDLPLGTTNDTGEFTPLNLVSGEPISVFHGFATELKLNGLNPTWSGWSLGLTLDTIPHDDTSFYARWGNWEPGSPAPWLAVDDIIVFDTIYDEPYDPEELHFAGRYGWIDHSIGTRIDKLIAYSEWPATSTIDTTGTPKVGSPLSGGSTVLAELRSLSDAALGLFYADRQGQLSFLNRESAWYDVATPTVTFTDAGGWSGTNLPYSVLSSPVVYDDRLLVNEVRISRRGGSGELLFSDATSQASFGTRSLALSDVPVATDNDLRTIADWKLVVGSDTARRVERVTVPTNRSSNAPALCSTLDIGDYVNLVRDSTTYKAHIVGVEHEIRGGEWTATFHLDGQWAQRAGDWGDWGDNWGAAQWAP